MVEVERYATTWHGLFPRFMFAGFVFPFGGILLQVTISALGSSLPYEAQDVASVAFFPFAIFALFYLASRIRINLGKDFAAVAASIFLGTLSFFLLFGLPAVLGPGSPLGASMVDPLLQSTASAVSGSIGYTFVGFAAILLSYRRRI
ncbi:MAG: hypothetical protein OK474_08455 [Thaumarchaeota archaeon]|nr:hypothetical protein [Nitrososphaerota archaeon]